MTTALIRYADRWAVEDPVLDYIILRHDALYHAALSGEPNAVKLYEEVCCGANAKIIDRSASAGRRSKGCGREVAC